MKMKKKKPIEILIVPPLPNVLYVPCYYYQLLPGQLRWDTDLLIELAGHTTHTQTFTQPNQAAEIYKPELPLVSQVSLVLSACQHSKALVFQHKSLSHNEGKVPLGAKYAASLEESAPFMLADGSEFESKFSLAREISSLIWTTPEYVTRHGSSIRVNTVLCELIPHKEACEEECKDILTGEVSVTLP